MKMYVLGVLSLLCLSLSRSWAIDTVSNVNVNKYIGTWYQVYTSRFSNFIILGDGKCVKAQYGLDEKSGNITVLNSKQSGKGEETSIRGYAYTPDKEEPGKLKVHLGAVPQDGDYWIIMLGEETYGEEGLYEYAVVSGPMMLNLFVLCRDVKSFKEKYEDQVLQELQELGFTNPLNKPIPTSQEGCMPRKSETEDGLVMKSLRKSEKQPPETIENLELEKYVGRWYQMYTSLLPSITFELGSVCAYADYELDDNGNILVKNTARRFSTTGSLSSVEGYAYNVNEKYPGRLKVHFNDVPVDDGDYWILALGPAATGEKHLYDWAIVGEPSLSSLFILARDVKAFEEKYEDEVVELAKSFGYDTLFNSPIKTVQKGCSYDFDLRRYPTIFGYPSHASCRVDLTFPSDSCEDVSKALVETVYAFGEPEECQDQKNCGYSISEANSYLFKGTHETPVQHYIDDMTFTLKDSTDGSCKALAESMSTVSYAFLDHSTNYCNLHNLLEASGIEYSEITADSVCTQYSSAECTLG